ncbi:MAG: hypothetical protein R3C44_21875 [Chloroflexota bacterium]
MQRGGGSWGWQSIELLARADSVPEGVVTGVGMMAANVGGGVIGGSQRLGRQHGIVWGWEPPK